MNNPYRLKQPIGESYNTNPDDVWATKQSLKLNGYYAEPKHGMNPYPDKQLLKSIKQFQRVNKLSVDGVMKPGGETEQSLLDQDEVAMTYWCTICGAPHGGVYSALICYQCWGQGYR